MLTSSQTKWNAYPEVTSCLYYRDESASATYYCKRKSVSESQEESTPNVEKEWIYYRKLKTGEEERCLRHKQVPGLALCSGKGGRTAVLRPSRGFGQGSSLLPGLQEIEKWVESCVPEGGTANNAFFRA